MYIDTDQPQYGSVLYCKTPLQATLIKAILHYKQFEYVASLTTHIKLLKTPIWGNCILLLLLPYKIANIQSPWLAYSDFILLICCELDVLSQTTKRLPYEPSTIWTFEFWSHLSNLQLQQWFEAKYNQPINPSSISWILSVKYTNLDSLSNEHLLNDKWCCPEQRLDLEQALFNWIQCVEEKITISQEVISVRP